MNHWLDTVICFLETGKPVVLVTVAACQGSTPREPGARMIVGPDMLFGTIGGGQLEWRAIAHARELSGSAASCAQVVRYPLGAKLGQCCGGVVHLVFEALGPAALPWLQRARQLKEKQLTWGRIVRLDHPAGACRVFGPKPEEDLDDVGLLATARRAILANHEQPVALLPVGAAPNLLIEISHPPSLEVMLFGGGHVGTALAEILRRLPLRLHWIDSREQAVPGSRPSAKGPVESDDPVTEVERAPPAAAFLVMTQSHALDFELVRAILERGDFRYCGLIGSATKRATFAARLRQRGFDESSLERLRCPIGIESVRGKEPEVIAVSVAAEILALGTAQSDALGARASALIQCTVRA